MRVCVEKVDVLGWTKSTAVLGFVNELGVESYLKLLLSFMVLMGWSMGCG